MYFNVYILNSTFTVNLHNGECSIFVTWPSHSGLHSDGLIVCTVKQDTVTHLVVYVPWYTVWHREHCVWLVLYTNVQIIWTTFQNVNSDKIDSIFRTNISANGWCVVGRIINYSRKSYNFTNTVAALMGSLVGCKPIKTCMMLFCITWSKNTYMFSVNCEFDG